MHLEYFQLIDRIVDLNIGEKTITVEAQVPTAQARSSRDTFPGYPIMPGVLLIESMAQTSGWLLLALMKFERMPFLAAVKEAKMRGFVTPGELLTIDANVASRRFRFCDDRSEGQRRRQAEMQRDDHVQPRPLPQSGVARAHGRDGPAHRLSTAGHLA